MAALHALLLARCHTPQRLRSEKYLLPADHLPSPTTTKDGTTPLYIPTPRHSPSKAKRKALVLDCERSASPARAATRKSVHISILDLFHRRSAARQSLVKLHRRVSPTGAPASPASRLRERRSSPAESRRERRCGGTWDENTVAVGRPSAATCGRSGVVHGWIVDGAILTAEPVVGEGRKLGNRVGLERLSRELLGLRIRVGAPAGGGRCHDSLEDVLATSELVVWCLRNPSDLMAWAVKNWGLEKKGKEKSGQRKRKLAGSDARSCSEDEDEEVLRWEDMVDWEVWPKSPPDCSD